MEYLGGGEVKWMNSDHEPIQTVDQSRRIIRDVILGLEYCMTHILEWDHHLTSFSPVHYQGIIHRDIKPANLLWTADRSKVKISDFGVSHFSYAQRLAAAGRDLDALDNPHDPILLDDSDLSKTAGTPSFLAPEVVFDFSTDVSPINSPGNTTVSANATVHACSDSPISRRQPITKSIDIWALGITLYCLLFGRTPFKGDQNEWVMYKAICSQDWDVGHVMGFDQIPTGGRQPENQDAEGFIVIDLLSRLLQKDARQRATLDQVKVSCSLKLI
jgi:[calcium/calmodulin-dependent protein kinase] kinase